MTDLRTFGWRLFVKPCRFTSRWKAKALLTSKAGRGDFLGGKISEGPMLTAKATTRTDALDAVKGKCDRWVQERQGDEMLKDVYFTDGIHRENSR